MAIPKRIQFNEAGGACFMDRCVGKIEGDCRGMTDNELLEGRCKMVCYGYKYNRCEDLEYFPIFIYKQIRSIF